MLHRLTILVLTALMAIPMTADGPADNQVDSVRPIPPPGTPLGPEERDRLEARLAELTSSLDRLRHEGSEKPEQLGALPNVTVLTKAVRSALDYNEFYQPNKEVAAAHRILDLAQDRIEALENETQPWNRQTGLVVRAYRSKIDGSAQPYGLVIPDDINLDSPKPIRLDAWFHGRGEKLTELAFIDQRMTSPGQFTPPQTIVLHLYGRYCNANKFAGEVDLFEAIEDVKKHYRVDENRIVVRGFSMGGAACWQFATHFAGQWAAAAPGAGFSETPEFLKFFQKETLNPTWYEKKLWNWYDATAYALNLFNCPTIAYSGENDRQKQAADIMAEALSKEGLHLTHIIGPDTGHRYHPEAKEKINRWIDEKATQGRDPVPHQVKFVTYTLRYSKMKWLELQGLETHWERAQIEADITNHQTVSIQTQNISAFSIQMGPGECPLDATKQPKVIINGHALEPAKVWTDRSWNPHFQKRGDAWVSIDTHNHAALRKKPGLQGPIDDAFLDSFLMVTPSGRALNGAVASWTATEQQHAITQWRSQFRGVPRTKIDTDVTTDDIAQHHLVLWGDPASNVLLRRLAPNLPIRWDREALQTDQRLYPVDRFVPVMIYPNPLNPERYIVINSGFTFREYDYLNNARQVAKLPDWAIVDISKPVTSRSPGEIADAGFFDEAWQLKPRP